MLKKLFTKATLTRTLSAVLLVIITVAAIAAGSYPLFFTILAVSITGLMELYRVAGIHKTLLGYAGYAAAVAYGGLVLKAGPQQDEFVMLFAIVFLMVLFSVYVFWFSCYNASQVFLAYFGVFYVVIMLFYIYRIRFLMDGFFLVWMVFISAWVCDTFAYLTGVTLGKHKLAPKLSPNKSIEGSIGGIIGSVLIGALYGFVFQNYLSAAFASISPAIGCAIVCGFGSVISQIGDLGASGIKRNFKTKDYGKLIPGHGGILDRFDSVIFVAPAIYYLCCWIGN